MGRRNRNERKSAATVGGLPVRPVVQMKFSFDHHEKFRDKLAVFQSTDFNWTVHLYRGMIFYEEYAVLDIFCHSSLANWSFEAEAEVTISQKLTHRMDHLFELKKNCISCPTLIKWKDLTNPENGYIQDGNINFSIKMARMPRKVCKNAAVFVKDYPGIKNLEIKVGKSTFRVNKQLLAYTSAFFDEEMDAGKLKEDEPYVLEEITPMDFRLYLDLVYHPKQYFSAYYAKDMLEIASRFRNTEIVTTCQNVILEDLKENKLSSKDKAKLAEVYDLDTVKELFRPEALIPPSSKPRFMVQEPRKLPDLRKIEAITSLVSESIVQHLEECPRAHAKNRHYTHNPREDQEEEEEEDIDQSVPSTSGISY